MNQNYLDIIDIVNKIESWETSRIGDVHIEDWKKLAAAKELTAITPKIAMALHHAARILYHISQNGTNGMEASVALKEIREILFAGNEK